MAASLLQFLNAQPVGVFVALPVLLDRWYGYRFDNRSAFADKSDQLGRTLIALGSCEYGLFPTEVGVMLRGRGISFDGQHATVRLHIRAAMCDEREAIIIPGQFNKGSGRRRDGFQNRRAG